MSKELTKQLTKIVNSSSILNESLIDEDTELFFIDKHLEGHVENVYNDIFKPIFNKNNSRGL